MKAMTNEKFAKAVMGMANGRRPFEPHVTYIREGDCIEFVIAPDDYYAHRIDGLVTVYYSRKTNNVVGSLIKGVNGFCKKMLGRFPGFRISIEGCTVKLEHIFLAQLWTKLPSSTDVAVTRTYRELIQAAEDQDLTVDIDEQCLT